MSLMTKIVVVLLCFSLCGVGTFSVMIARKENEPRKTNVIPVKNRDIVRLTWIVT